MPAHCLQARFSLQVSDCVSDEQHVLEQAGGGGFAACCMDAARYPAASAVVGVAVRRPAEPALQHVQASSPSITLPSASQLARGQAGQ